MVIFKENRMMAIISDDGNIQRKWIGGDLLWKQSDADPGLIQMPRDFSVWSRITVSPWITMMATMMISMSMIMTMKMSKMNTMIRSLYARGVF